MKKFSKFIAAVLAVAAILSAFAGCSVRTPVTADGFQKLAKGQGFKVETGAGGSSGVTTYLTATKPESETTVDFLLLQNDSSAEEQYASLKKNAAPNGGGKAVDSATYNRYIVTNGELYYNIVRMDNTIIYAKSDLTNQDEVDNFIKAAKY